MEDNIRYGYCRCSTNEINQDITRQINELKKVGVLEENIIYEFISGTKEKKPKLTELLSKCNLCPRNCSVDRKTKIRINYE